MKYLSVLFLTLMFAFLCTESNSSRLKLENTLIKSQIINTTSPEVFNPINNTTSNTTSLVVIDLSNITDLNTTRLIVPKPFNATVISVSGNVDAIKTTESSNTTKEELHEISELKKALDEFYLNVDELFIRLKTHNELYDSWIAEAKTDEEKNSLRDNEKKNLDEFTSTAMGLYSFVLSIKSQLNSYNGAINNTDIENAASTNTTVISSHSQTGVSNYDSSDLIELISKRYDLLGLKKDSRITNLLQMNMSVKTINKKKNFLKSDSKKSCTRYVLHG